MTMIEYKEFKTPSNIKETENVLSLLGNTFGEEEKELERKQLSGEEKEFNTDYLFTAYEDRKLLGNIHLTVNNKNGAFGCLGGLVTVPESRGKGVGKTLFGKACEYFDVLNGKILFLGTNNEMAARIYQKFGFSFITGTNVMVRVKDGCFFDFCKEFYSDREYSITEMDDGCRVPIIPLIVSRGRDMLMDANANIISTDYATQISCTGLYPRFLRIKENGGNIFVAKLNNQAICAIATVCEKDGKNNVDCFSYKGYENVLFYMLGRIIKDGKEYSAIIAEKDIEKLKLFESFGFKNISNYDYSFNGLHIPAYLLERRK